MLILVTRYGRGVGRRAARLVSLLTAAGLLLVANWLPVVSAQVPPALANREQLLSSLQTARHAMAVSQTVIITTYKPALYQALQEVEDSLNPQLGWLIGRMPRPCQAITYLSRSLDLLAQARSQTSKPELEELYVYFWTLRQDLAQSLPVGTACDGVEPIQAEPTLKVGYSDNLRTEFAVGFGSPNLTLQKANGRTFTRVQGASCFGKSAVGQVRS